MPAVEVLGVGAVAELVPPVATVYHFNECDGDEMAVAVKAVAVAS